ncbi:hypothetical protein PLICBS_006543 [Purpureocillium lilacinum]|uniref:uncharacterized protein n=1 Tax=Purpureocillium lilacinum TaxID=33203 RepID=UPI00208AE609|nr:hypothetical protein PLICBS_006543 [Purpureocillium lilacinum]
MFDEAVANLTCPVQGKADLYGLGIRVGAYIQMLTVQLSGALSIKYRVEDHVGQGVLIFVGATAIVLVRLIHATVRQHGTLDGPLQPVEVFPILTLLMIQIGLYPLRATKAAVFWLAEVVGLTALFTWFWWHGMEMLPRSCPDDKAFFFAQVSIWNWYRDFNKVVALLLVLTLPVIALGLLMAERFKILRERHFARNDESAALNNESEPSNDEILYNFPMHFTGVIAPNNEVDEPNNEVNAPNNAVEAANNEGVADEEHRRFGTKSAGFKVAVNWFAIVYVEVSLKWNNIQDVHSLDSPGQFMPFVIALGQLVTVLFLAYKARRYPAADQHAIDLEGESEWQCRHAQQNQGIAGDIRLADL